MEKGKLYLIPNTLGDTPPLEVMPLAIKKAIERIDHYIVENEKTARHFIKKISSGKSQPNLKIELLNKFTDQSLLPSFLEPCLQGFDMGVISEAGCPGVADPGAEVVAIAHEKGIKVVPLVGPSSILLALMASGLNGQQFSFSGYLPIDKMDRKKKLKAMECISRDLGQTQIFIETPYRNDNLLTDLTKMLGGHTRLCVACDISLPTEYIKTMTVNEWKNEKVELHKRPAIFLFLA